MMYCVPRGNLSAMTYLGYIVLFGRTWNQYDACPKRDLTRIQDAGLKIINEKGFFAIMQAFPQQM